jgi:hypothetical protein
MSDNETSLDIGIKVSDIKKSSTVFPAQKARMVIEKLSLEWNKDETIKNLNVRLAFVGGPLDGRKMFARHPVSTTRTDEGMKTAIGIGHDRIKEMGDACGVSGSDLAGCLNKELDVTIGVNPAKGGFPESNDVKRYDAASAAPVAKASGAPAFMKKKAPPAAEAPAADEAT